MIAAKNQISFTQNGIINKQNSNDIQKANKLLDDLNNDGMITPFEKQQLDNEFQNLVPEHDSLVEQCTNYSLTTEQDFIDFKTAYFTLNDLLYKNTDAPLKDMSTTSEIDLSTIRNAFITYYSKRDIVNSLINTTIDNKAASAATDAENAVNTAENANNKATNALTTATSKTTVFTQQAQPTPLATGDIWYKIDSNNKIIAVYIWSNTGWIEKKFDYNTLSVGKLSALSTDLGSVTAGSININDNFVVGSDGTIQAKKGNFSGDITSKLVTVGSENANDYKETINAGYFPYLMKFRNPTPDFETGNYIYDENSFAVASEGNVFSIMKVIEKDGNLENADPARDGTGLFNTNMSFQTPILMVTDNMQFGSNFVGRICEAQDNDSAKTYRGYIQHDNGVKITKYQSNALAPLFANSLFLGSDRQQVPIITTGKVTISPTANTPTSKNISFGHTYSSAPVVMVTAQTTVPGTTVTGCGASNIAVDACDIFVTRTNSTNTVLMWVAIGI